MLMHCFPLQMICLQILVSQLDWLVVHVTVILSLEFLLFPDWVYIRSIWLLVVKVRVLEGWDHIVVFPGAETAALTTVQVVFSVLGGGFLYAVVHMVATGVVEKVLALAVLFDIVKPVASRIVVKRYASSDFLSKVACIVCLIHLFGKTVLFA